MAAAPKNGSQAAGSQATGSQATGSKAAGGRRAVLIASGDLREEANRVCWPAQQAMEQALAKACDLRATRSGQHHAQCVEQHAASLRLDIDGQDVPAGVRRMCGQGVDELSHVRFRSGWSVEPSGVERWATPGVESTAWGAWADDPVPGHPGLVRAIGRDADHVAGCPSMARTPGISRRGSSPP